MSFDPTKPVQRRDGRPACIIHTDAKGPYPIIALVEKTEGMETPVGYTKGGKSYHTCFPSYEDLVNVPHSEFVNIYPYDVGDRRYKTRGQADTEAGPGRVAVLELVNNANGACRDLIVHKC